MREQEAAAKDCCKVKYSDFSCQHLVQPQAAGRSGEVLRWTYTQGKPEAAAKKNLDLNCSTATPCAQAAGRSGEVPCWTYMQGKPEMAEQIQQERRE